MNLQLNNEKINYILFFLLNKNCFNKKLYQRFQHKCKQKIVFLTTDDILIINFFYNLKSKIFKDKFIKLYDSFCVTFAVTVYENIEPILFVNVLNTFLSFTIANL